MRFIAVFLVGGLLAFYVTEVLSQIFKKIHPNPLNFNIHHSILGPVLFLAGITSLLWGQIILGSPNNLLLAILLFGAGLGIIFHHLLVESFIFSEKAEKDFIAKHDKGIEFGFPLHYHMPLLILLSLPIFTGSLRPCGLLF